MGVPLIAAACAAATGVGAWSDCLWPRGAAEAARKGLVLILYFLLPPGIFFHLASAEIDLDHGVGLGLAILSIALSSVLVCFASSRLMPLPRHQVGAMICTVLVVNTAYLGYPMSVALL